MEVMLRVVARLTRALFWVAVVGASVLVGAMIAAGALSGVVRTIAAGHIASTIDVAGVSLTVVPGLDWGVAAVGVTVTILGEAFRHGAELQRDHDLTV